VNWQFLKYTLLFLLPASAWISFNSTGTWTYSSALLAFGIIPGLEIFIKPKADNLDAIQEVMMLKDKKYDYLLYLGALLHWLLLIYFLHVMNSSSIDWVDRIGMVCSMGVLCGVTGINLAHELGHRKNKNEIRLALSLLLTSLYMHFYIEHNRGHHKNVATLQDPASAQKDESLYTFWFRSSIGSYLSAWALEEKRLNAEHLPVLSLKNQMVRFTVLQIGFITLIASYFSLQVIFCFMGAALLGGLLLETVNYIEHYGLTRKTTLSGRAERVQPHHSWNSNHPIGRMFLFELSRHSDHHFLATRPYQILRSFEDAPQMPTGYPGMMIIAFIPPLWFKIMNPRIPEGMKPVQA